MWTGCLAFHLYCIIVHRDAGAARSQCLEPMYHAVSWGLPLVTCIIIYARELEGHQQMGPSNRPWCWITAAAPVNQAAVNSGTSPSNWMLEQLGLFYIPCAVIFSFNVGVYAAITCHLGRCCTPCFGQRAAGSRWDDADSALLPNVRAGLDKSPRSAELGRFARDATEDAVLARSPRSPHSLSTTAASAAPTLPPRGVVTRLCAFVLIFFFCAVWGLAHRVWDFWRVDDPEGPLLAGWPILVYGEALFTPLQGFLNALVYGTGGTNARLIAACGRRAGGCRGCGGAAAAERRRRRGSSLGSIVSPPLGGGGAVRGEAAAAAAASAASDSEARAAADVGSAAAEPWYLSGGSVRVAPVAAAPGYDGGESNSPSLHGGSAS